MGEGRDSGETENLERFYPHHPETLQELYHALAITTPDLNLTNAPSESSSDSTSTDGDDSTLSDPDQGGSGWLSAVFLMVNATLGAGLLNFPQAFDQAGGITVALLVQFVLVLCVGFGLLVLAHSSWHVHAANLLDTMASTCGKKGSVLCSLLIALYCFGTCVTFFIITGDQFDRVLMTLYGPTFCHTWYMNRQFTSIVSTLIFIYPVYHSRKMGVLKYGSSLGVVAIVYIVGLVVTQYYTGGFVPGPIKTSPNHWIDVFHVVPVICFGYQSHVSVVSVYSCMGDRRISSFTTVIIASLAVCGVAYSLTGVYGYLTFGSRVSSDVLQDYGGTNVAVLVGIAAMAVKTVTTYPIMLYCGREAVINLWRTPDWDHGNEKTNRSIINNLWILTTFILSNFTPGIGIAIDALGSLAAVFIFAFPGLCLLQTCLQRDPGLMARRMQFYVTMAVLFIAAGAFIFGVVLVQTTERLFEPSQDSPLLCTY